MGSEKTAMTRKAPSAPMQWLASQGLLHGRMLDFGCGKGFDADYYGMGKYDPFYFANRNPVKWSMFFDVVTCNYVLNVLPDETTVNTVLENIKKLLKSDGRAYIAVRRDLPRKGKPGKDCYQRYIELDLPVVKETSAFCIYQLKA